MNMVTAAKKGGKADSMRGESVPSLGLVLPFSFRVLI